MPGSFLVMVAIGPPPMLMPGCNLEHVTEQNILARGNCVVNLPRDDPVAIR